MDRLEGFIDSAVPRDPKFHAFLEDYARIAESYAEYFLALSEEAVTTCMLIDVVNSLDSALIRSGPSTKATTLMALIEKKYAAMLRAYNSRWSSSATTSALVTVEECESKFIPVRALPQTLSFEDFFVHKSRPFVVRNSLVEWGALQRWKDFGVFHERHGHRLVPVEVGASYLRENWSQRLMPLGSLCESILRHDTSEILYLAQHDIFSQIPELLEDIEMPQYILDPEQQITNAWIGMAGTQSPLHFDKYDNFFCQVVGYKRIYLIDPAHHIALPSRDNTIGVELHPREFLPLGVSVYCCILGPGDLCYIPKHWWHHVEAVSNSISVSFWHYS